MDYIEKHCDFLELREELLRQCPPFSCAKDKDIEDFFCGEYKDFAAQLFGKSYGFFSDDETPRLVAAFTVSNSMLPVDTFPKNIRNRINRSVPNAKRRVQHPAVLVGQLAVFDGFHGLGIGDEVLDFVKAWFIAPDNKTGCRYLIVDAVNHPKVLDFYLRNGFKFIFEHIEAEIAYMKLDLDPEYKHTRLMYFDLIVLNRAS